MSPSDILVLGGTAAMLASAFVIVYMAIRLRRALVDRAYRTRAFWTAMGALSIVGFITAGYVDSVYGQTPTTVEGVLVEAAAWGFTFLVLIGWIASNIDVALSADFFNRDPLRWKKGGKILMIAVILTAYITASIPPWWIPQLVANLDLFAATFNAVFAIVIIYSVAVLALTIIRIQDRRIKNYTMWVVLSIIFLFVTIFAPGVLVVFPAAAWIYSMFRSVGSLAIRTRTLPT
jgi:hypothetical protein